MTVKGQDWASYQSATPSTSGLDFAFIKATEGTSYVNPRMTSQAATARAAGLVVGFYHFLHPGGITAQAAYFVGKAASRAGDPLFVDWENTSAGARANSTEKDQFIREVRRLRGSTHRVGLYCNRDFWLGRDTSGFAGDALWIADYTTPGKPRIQATWLFHQYTSTPIDTNIGRFADRAALVAWAGAAEEDDMPIRTSLGKDTSQKAGWDKWTVISWDREYADPEHAHASGDHPGYSSPVSGWVDCNGRLVVKGMKAGDQLQVRYEVHDWSDGRSTGAWTEIIADVQCTPGDQFLSLPFSKGLKKGQHMYVALKPLAGPGRQTAPAPTVTDGRWTVRQDRG